MDVDCETAKEPVRIPRNLKRNQTKGKNCDASP